MQRRHPDKAPKADAEAWKINVAYAVLTGKGKKDFRKDAPRPTEDFADMIWWDSMQTCWKMMLDASVAWGQVPLRVAEITAANWAAVASMNPFLAPWLMRGRAPDKTTSAAPEEEAPETSASLPSSRSR